MCICMYSTVDIKIKKTSQELNLARNRMGLWVLSKLCCTECLKKVDTFE